MTATGKIVVVNGNMITVAFDGAVAQNEVGYAICGDKRLMAEIVRVREHTKKALRALGFEMTDSLGNFLFVRHPRHKGEKIYRELRRRGILVRHFSSILISDYNRITVGTMAEMEALIEALSDITKE